MFDIITVIFFNAIFFYWLPVGDFFPIKPQFIKDKYTFFLLSIVAVSLPFMLWMQLRQLNCLECTLCHAMQAFNLGAGAESISDECDTVFMKFLEWFMCGIWFKIILKSCFVKMER